MKKKLSYYGFNLNSICWGYRDLFYEVIESLFSRELIGENKKAVTSQFFKTLKESNRQFFDHVLKEFLDALSSESAWILDIPAIFEEVTDMGIRLAKIKINYGVTFFQILGQGGFGNTPDSVHFLINHLRRLIRLDPETAIAFLKGYKSLRQSLANAEIEVFIREALALHQVNPLTCNKFLDLSLKSSHTTIQRLTTECRLKDIQRQLEKLVYALTQREVKIENLNKLDSDQILERNCHVVCFSRKLFLPGTIHYFPKKHQNRSYYFLQSLIAAGMLIHKSFPLFHGQNQYMNLADISWNNCFRHNMIQVIEYCRILTWAKKNWPGIIHLLEFGFKFERQFSKNNKGAEELFMDMFNQTASANITAILNKICRQSGSIFDSLELLKQIDKREILYQYCNVNQIPIRTFSFFPDFNYHLKFNPPISNYYTAKQSKKNDNNKKKKQSLKAKNSQFKKNELKKNELKKKESSEEQTAFTKYTYDEWSQDEGDYYKNFCHLAETKIIQTKHKPVNGELEKQGQRIQKIFELLKPDEMNKIKYLADGDSLNHDHFCEFLIQRKHEPSPPIRFYEKPFIKRRSLAVLLLIDISGSTGDKVRNQKTLDIEKQASLILGQGLYTLNDQFAICGFSGNGPKNCEFHVYKDFSEKWDEIAKSRIFAAKPISSTRIGPALRHSGFKLSFADARQKLIILITDGKPMDTDYSPETRYAQHDVRMANLENRRAGIITFGISTLQNSRSDMEIMFPDRRYLILNHINDLIAVLPKTYMKLTL